MEQEAKELWALVELFGHNRVAGKVTEAEIGGGSLIRVDVPAVRDREPLTKYYNVKAIYALGSVLICLLGLALVAACLIGKLAFGIIHGLELPHFGIVMAESGYVTGNPQFISVLGISPEVDMPGILILQIGADRTAHDAEQVYQIVADADRHFSLLSGLKREWLESGLLGMGESRRQSPSENGERKATASYFGGASADVPDVKLYRPRMSVRDSQSRYHRPGFQPNPANDQSGPEADHYGATCLPSLPAQKHEREKCSNGKPPVRRVAFSPTPSRHDAPFGGCIQPGRFLAGGGLMCVSVVVFICAFRSMNGWLALLSCVLFGIGSLLWLTDHVPCESEEHSDNSQSSLHNSEIVLQKYLTSPYLLQYSNYMANVLNTDKQIAIIGALTEGSSIRSIERMTGVHRDTIMRLGVRVGQGCTALMDSKMRDLPCDRLELDEIWGFVGKKDRNVRMDDSTAVGSVWTFCAIDADTKLVPAFRVGDRTPATATAFVQDVANRMSKRVQISTDGLAAYRVAVESAFGADVDFAQIIKTYGHEEMSDNRRYSAPEFVSSEKKVITGRPNFDLISTSYIERLNATTRLHMRRLTRLTLAFSKKRENFEAAVGLHFAYYNFVKRHNTLRCTPAMAAGITPSFWSVGDLLEATA